MPEMQLADPVREHREKSAGTAGVAVITLSSTRSGKNDQSGNVIQDLLESRGHSVPVRKIITDSRNVLRATLRGLIRQEEVQAIITSGGTGISATDITVETVRGMLDKDLPGFQTLFMLLSYRKVKSAAMLSRTMAGTIKGKPIFCLPGSPRACKLAMESLILPELTHLLMLLRA